jgi:hypothetical protein
MRGGGLFSSTCVGARALAKGGALRRQGIRQAASPLECGVVRGRACASEEAGAFLSGGESARAAAVRFERRRRRRRLLRNAQSSSHPSSNGTPHSQSTTRSHQLPRLHALERCVSSPIPPSPTVGVCARWERARAPPPASLAHAPTLKTSTPGARVPPRRSYIMGSFSRQFYLKLAGGCFAVRGTLGGERPRSRAKRNAADAHEASHPAPPPPPFPQNDHHPTRSAPSWSSS